MRQTIQNPWVKCSNCSIDQQMKRIPPEDDDEDPMPKSPDCKFCGHSLENAFSVDDNDDE